MPDPIPNPPTDPVPEPLRPTARRLTYWTLAAVALFVVIGSAFLIVEMMQRPTPTASSNPPAGQHSTQPQQSNG